MSIQGDGLYSKQQNYKSYNNLEEKNRDVNEKTDNENSDEFIIIIESNKKKNDKFLNKKRKFPEKKDGSSFSFLNNNLIKNEEDYLKSFIVSNSKINKKSNKITKFNIKFDENAVTDDSTKNIAISYPKIRNLYGDWLNNKEKYDLSNYKCKNSFLRKHKHLIENISYFSNNPPIFLNHIIMLIKAKIAYMAQKMINSLIINSDNYQLHKISYNNFVKNTSGDFNDKYLYKKLDELFIEFQEDNQEENKNVLKDNNKKVIKYIKKHSAKELDAFEYLGNSFYELFKEFKEKHLDKHLKEIEGNLKEKNISEEKIKALVELIKTVSSEYKDYFELIDKRKKK